MIVLKTAKELERMKKACIISAQALEPVSYTHLDVYKRQDPSNVERQEMESY